MIFDDVRARLAAGLATLGAIAAWRYGALVAVVATSTFVLAWLAWFSGARAIVSLIRGGRPTAKQAAPGAIGIVGCVGVCAAGFAPVVAIAIGCYVVIDCVFLASGIWPWDLPRS